MNNQEKINQYKKNIKDNSFYYKDNSQEINLFKDYYDKNNKNINLNSNTYQYLPSLTIIFSNGNVMKATEFIRILQIEMNFTQYIFPLFTLQLHINQNYIPVIQFDDDVKFRIEMYYKSDMDDNLFTTEKLFDITLKKIKQNDSPVNINNLVTMDDTDDMIRKQIIDLKLIPVECLKANKILFSGVYSNCSITDLIANMTSKLDNEVFIEKPDNDRKYNQIIFIPYNVFFNIKYLNDYYGIYNYGLKMFYGFNKFRIQSKKFFSYNEGVNKVRVLFSSSVIETTSDYNQEAVMSPLNKDNIIYINSDNVKVLDNRYSGKEVFGSNIYYFGHESNSEYSYYRNDNMDSGKLNKTRTYINNFNNDFKEKELKNDINYSKTVEFDVSNVLLDVDSWFKPFNLNFESSLYSDYNGNYVLNNIIINLYNSSTDSNMYFNPSMKLNLKQVEENS